jgi:hypothetical protein
MNRQKLKNGIIAVGSGVGIYVVSTLLDEFFRPIMLKNSSFKGLFSPSPTGFDLLLMLLIVVSAICIIAGTVYSLLALIEKE